MKKKSTATKQKHIEKDTLYGAHAIIEMLKAKKRKLYTLYTRKPLPKAWERIKKFLPQQTPNIQYVEKNVLDGIAQSAEHMSVVAVTSPFPLYKQTLSPESHPFIVLIDGVQDVRNLGGILRSAYCSGVDAVVLTKSNTAPLCSAVFKASAGLAEHLDIQILPSIKSAVQTLKQAGYNFYITVIDGNDATQITYKQPACLVIGNEASGVTQDSKLSGQLVTIPQRTPDISYNASVAAGIMFFIMSQSFKK